MPSPPSKLLQEIVSLLIPPACREEVLGDLSEISTSSAHYLRQAVLVVPLVIGSRIRRTADPLLVLLEASALYLFFVGAAWILGDTDLFRDLGLIRLAIPPAWFLFGLALDEAYTVPGKTSLLRTLRGPFLGLGFAYLAQLAFSASAPALALPPWIMLYGSAFGMFFSITVKRLFPPVTHRPLGAAGPAFWLKYVPPPLHIPPEAISIAKIIALVLAIAFLAAQLGGPALSAALVFLSVLLAIVRELRRRY